MPVSFLTPAGVAIPAVTAAQMREVDRIAVADFGLSVLQMMENAGRNLALSAIEMMEKPGKVVVLAGSGGNGGGGICCARHLHNRGYPVAIALTTHPEKARQEVQAQLKILNLAGVELLTPETLTKEIATAALVIDAIIGYSLQGAPRGVSLASINLCHEFAGPILSLDMPSGVDATTGATPGAWVQPTRTLTLALPKTGLAAVPGELYLGDIGIPAAVYHPLGIRFPPFFGEKYLIELSRGVEGGV